MEEPTVGWRDGAWRGALRSGVQALVLAAGFAWIAAAVRERLRADFDAGGDPWRQGDWLISGPVRRGLGGDAILALSDRIDPGPVAIVITIQILLFGVILLSLFVAQARARFDARFVVLALAPLGLAFWAWDTHGIARKELLVYAALGVIAAAPRSRLALSAASLLIAVGFLTHEAMLCFVPAWFVALWLVHRSGVDRRWVVASALFTAGVALVSAALVLVRVGDGQSLLVCSEIVGRGVGRHVCDGAMDHVDGSYTRGRLFVSKNREAGHGGRHLLLGVLGLALLVALRPVAMSARRCGAVIAALAVPFLPLFFVAVDWGRWMNFHFVSALVLALIAVNARVLERRAPLGLPVFVVWLLAGLVWTVPHWIGVPAELSPLAQAVLDRL